MTRVSVVPPKPEQVSCPEAQTFACDAGKDSKAVAVSTLQAMARDQDGNKVDARDVRLMAKGIVDGQKIAFPLGKTEVTLMPVDATDPSTGACSFDVIVEDREPPQVKCHGDQTLNTLPGLPYALVTLPPPTATDNDKDRESEIVTTAVLKAPTSTGPLAGPRSEDHGRHRFVIGKSELVYSLTDASKNTATCVGNVSVFDREKPQITCPPPVAMRAPEGHGARISMKVEQAKATDNSGQLRKIETWCEGILVQNATAGSGQGHQLLAELKLGANNLQHQATDNSGNKASCKSVVNIQPPVGQKEAAAAPQKSAQAKAQEDAKAKVAEKAAPTPREVKKVTPAVQRPATSQRPSHTEAQLRAGRTALLNDPVSLSANGGWLAFDTPLSAGSQSTLCFHLWLVDDGSMQGSSIPDGEATARHITQTARDSLTNLTPNLRVSRPKGSPHSKFYLSGPRSVDKRSLQGSYSYSSATFSKWVHVCLVLDDMTVQLFVDAQLEASYTVQGSAGSSAAALHEAVLFGSGDDFNGMSALVDGVVVYRTLALSEEDCRQEQRMHTTLRLPSALQRPLVDTGPDLIFDDGISIRLQQLALPEHSRPAPSQPGSTAAQPQGSVSEEVLAHYLVAHALGCQRAHLALGHRHLYGIGGSSQSCKLAAHYYLFAAEKAIDDMIQFNVNTTRDAEFVLHETDGTQDGLLAQVDRYGGILGDDDHLVKRMKELAKPSAKNKKGDAAAQYWLAKHYYWGRAGLPLNFTDALHFNRMAATQGHAEALQFMGILYAKGHGVEANHDVGLDYSTQAAAKGNLAAHNTIGYYHERQGDYITALKHFKKAADQNNSYGHYNIALLYTDGLGTLRQDKQKALEHFISSAELGHPSCMLMVSTPQRLLPTETSFPPALVES
eukprot:COSAG04_NODE_1630_length_6113_cov_2.069338_2_plen_898_part_00